MAYLADDQQCSVTVRTIIDSRARPRERPGVRRGSTVVGASLIAVVAVYNPFRRRAALDSGVTFNESVNDATGGGHTGHMRRDDYPRIVP